MRQEKRSARKVEAEKFRLILVVLVVLVNLVKLEVLVLR